MVGQRKKRLLCLKVYTNTILGTLFAAAKSDPDLKKYDVIVIDEAHMHTVQSDLLLGLLKQLAIRRPDLKIVIMSATMDENLFLDFFPGSQIERFAGSTYPVQVEYLPQKPQSNEGVMAATVSAILQIHVKGKSGDILLFASGVPIISAIIAEVTTKLTGKHTPFTPDLVGPLACYPLHEQLSTEEQTEAVTSVRP